MSKRPTKVDDKWNIYAMMGEPDDLRLDGHEPTAAETDAVLDEGQYNLCLHPLEKDYIGKYGYEPAENVMETPSWPAVDETKARVIPINGSVGRRWMIKETDFVNLVSTVFSRCREETLSFDLYVAPEEAGERLLTIVQQDYPTDVFSFFAFEPQQLPYYLPAIEGKRVVIFCERSNGAMWIARPGDFEQLHLRGMLELSSGEPL